MFLDSPTPVIAASMVGGVAFPPALGSAFASAGAASIPLLLAALSAVCLILAVACRARPGHPVYLATERC